MFISAFRPSLKHRSTSELLLDFPQHSAGFDKLFPSAEIQRNNYWSREDRKLPYFSGLKFVGNLVVAEITQPRLSRESRCIWSKSSLEHLRDMHEGSTEEYQQALRGAAICGLEALENHSFNAAREVLLT